MTRGQFLAPFASRKRGMERGRREDRQKDFPAKCAPKMCLRFAARVVCAFFFFIFF